MSKPQTGQTHSKSWAKQRRPAATAYPSFIGLKPASQASSQAKKANKSQGTRPEVILKRVLRRLGLRFKRNVKALQGKPDIVLLDEKVALFCDGDFWHGRNWPTLRHKLIKGTNGKYWVRKIRMNIEQDLNNSADLKKSGWRVIRLWESEILRDHKKIQEKLMKLL